ncbi:MAG TPA: glycerophosphoryl diester phosphodiesterase membrane domain-containing protein [Terriglobia bacterium]|nr:glycerophosphoryl diester phosphodiesterase membrane domain-containing protein [Terriglobia bacterium]
MELRPLSIGELLDRTFSYYRNNFWLFAGIVAAPQVAMVAVSIFMQSLRLTGTPPPPSKDPTDIIARFPAMMAGFAITMVVLMLAAIIIYSLVQGAVAYALSEVHLGRLTTVKAAFRNLKGKAWRLIDVVVSIGIRVMGIFILMWLGLVLIVAVPAGLITGLGKPGPVFITIVVILLILGMLAAIVLAPVLMMRYALAVPALVLENLTARQAIKRSVKLAKGNIWKIFLIFLLMYMITTVVISVFQGPFIVASIVIAARHGVPPLWLQIPSAISGGIGGTLSGPLIAIALTLLYFDARVRKEGFDLQLMMDSLGTQASALEPPSITAPGATAEP